MSKINDGGNAFPSAPPLPFNTGLQHGDAGMSLRDWFAGQALAGMLSDLEHGYRNSVEDTADHAYRYADAMLKSREAEHGAR